MIDFAMLRRHTRILVEAPLKPVQGDRFQPTGFADIGAAEYTRPGKDGGTPMLLVESAQSVANRLERTCLNAIGDDLDPALEGLAYVKAVLKGDGVEEIQTSSLLEAHRLASPYVLNGRESGSKQAFKEVLASKMKYTGKGPLKWADIYSTLFQYDPNSLVHGVFLSTLHDGRVRVPRAVTGFIEAENVANAVSGGVKNSSVDPKGEIRAIDEPKDVYSNVPYSRIEYVGTIRAHFNIDLSLIHGFGLPEEASHLLIALSLYKVRRFLSSHLRLRTACDLVLAGDVAVTQPEGFILPDEAELLGAVQEAIGKCQPHFANPAVTTLTTTVERKSKKEAKAEPKASEQPDDDETGADV